MLVSCGSIWHWTAKVPSTSKFTFADYCLVNLDLKVFRNERG